MIAKEVYITNLFKKLGVGGIGLAVAASGIVGFSSSALAQSSSASDPSTYIAPLHTLNHSGVTGFANLSLNSTQPGAALTASVNARGAEPNQIHAMHIHGMLDGSDAECPNFTADTNADKLVSVFEGAPFYGPIKVNFTTPPTTFGPPSRTDLFAPFAGVPVFANFPHSDSSGKVSYGQTIPFDASNHYAVEALTSLTPLNDQHIVIHGGFAPESVDTPGGDPNKIVYDALLPVACGPIIQTHRGSAGSQSANNNDTTNSASISNTGAGSTNSITNSSSNSSKVTNSNDVQISNQNNQTSTTGNASATSNTNSGSAFSGNANSNGSAAFMSRLMNSGFKP